MNLIPQGPFGILRQFSHEHQIAASKRLCSSSKLFSSLSRDSPSISAHNWSDGHPSLLLLWSLTKRWHTVQYYDTLPSPCLQDQTVCLPGTIMKNTTSPWPTLCLALYMWSFPWNKPFKSRFYHIRLPDPTVQSSHFETPHPQHVSNALLLANRLGTPNPQSHLDSSEDLNLRAPCFYGLILLGDILGPKCIQRQPCRICNFFFQNFLETSGAVRPFSCDNTIQLSNMLPWLWQWSLPELPTFSSTPGYPRAAICCGKKRLAYVKAWICKNLLCEAFPVQVDPNIDDVALKNIALSIVSIPIIPND